MPRHLIAVILLALSLHAIGSAQTSALWREEKVRNYLPHMTWPDVQDLLTRTDMVIVPVPSLEQHGRHLPIGTDFLTGVEEAKLVAQRADVLVAPILFPGQSGYHMEFPGTITLSSDTMQRVYFEAAQSLLRHGFKRFLFLNSHTGNQHITRVVIDRINQETAGIAVELNEASQTMRVTAAQPTPQPTPQASGGGARVFDRHGGVGETASGLYLFPSLVQMDKAETPRLTLPAHLAAMLPQVIAGDRAATLVFLAEALKPRETGKKTSAREMSTTGAWSERDPRDATAEQGRRSTEAFVEGAVRFIARWNELRPYRRPQP